MRITRIQLKNWLNFQELDSGTLADRVFVIGPNAVGKSNLLDAFRFLRDVALPAGRRPQAGGLQNAVTGMRGGLSKLRCLNARKDTEVWIQVELADADGTRWNYELGFKGEGRANNRIIVCRERVEKNGKCLLMRPCEADKKDPEQLTQTHLELTNANSAFRDLSHFLSETTYLHLVPQLLKYASRIGGSVIDSDPFGQGFLKRIAATGPRARDARLNRIQRALGSIAPQFKQIRFVLDPATGTPHLEANFVHWRPSGAWQREDRLSDGTLRLIGLLWSLMEGSSLLLVEEPELSLNEEVVRKLASVIRQIQKESKVSRQVMVTTHSEALLSDQSIDPAEVLRLLPNRQGTTVRHVDEKEQVLLDSGLNAAEVLLPTIRPKDLDQLHLALQ